MGHVTITVPILGVVFYLVRHQKTRVPGLTCGIICVILHLALLIQYQSVTDRQTHDDGKYYTGILSHGKNGKSPYLQHHSIDFDKYGTVMQLGPHSQSAVNISWIWKSKMVDAAILKNKKCGISTTIWPILMKFSVVMHMGPNLQFCKSNDGRLFCEYSKLFVVHFLRG